MYGRFLQMLTVQQRSFWFMCYLSRRNNRLNDPERIFSLDRKRIKAFPVIYFYMDFFSFVEGSPQNILRRNRRTDRM